MTAPVPPGAPVPGSSQRKLGGLIGAGALVLLIATAGIAGAVLGPSKTKAVAASSPTATSSSSPAVSAPPSTTAPAATPSPSPTTAAPKPTPTATSAAPLPSPSSYLAPASARNKAAGILRANNAYYLAEFNHGVNVVLDRGQPNSYPAFYAWYQKAQTADPQPAMTAFKQADAVFNADDEPQSISDWRDDNVTMTSDMAQMANDGLGVGGPDDASARQRVEADIKQFQKDYAAVVKDADNVAAGK
ncbi:hypothetical protein [Streptacidiphilus monticola]|uniref:Uncharacterized protein n=1 Tax=Streptacidiphilus monticola TaxID=2161674 RepID=A0ABW1G898_9ACTN